MQQLTNVTAEPALQIPCILIDLVFACTNVCLLFSLSLPSPTPSHPLQHKSVCNAEQVQDVLQCFSQFGKCSDQCILLTEVHSCVHMQLLVLFSVSHILTTGQFCIAEIFSGSLGCDKCYYLKAINDTVVISFGLIIQCSTVH
jgi:hypothetical protein